MAKPVAGEIVVLPFPQTDLQTGKRRPALVLVSLPGNDLILCQITGHMRTDPYSVLLTTGDLDRGRLAVDSCARVNRLFTVEDSVVLYVAAKVTSAKLAEARTKVRQLFA